MRTIKFRAWDYEIRKMLSSASLAPRIYEAVYGFDKDDKATSLAVMQYTGLKDKNGKEIYEGDIVDWKGKKEVVEWYARGCWYPFIYVEGGVNKHLDQAFSQDMEIIGNIYEDGHLLNK